MSSNGRKSGSTQTTPTAPLRGSENEDTQRTRSPAASPCKRTEGTQTTGTQTTVTGEKGGSSSFVKWAAIGAGAALGATAFVFGAPAAIAAVGFGADGIVKGSVAASAMSTAWTTGYGVGIVSTLQGVGAAGFSAAGTGGLAAAGGAAGAAAGGYFSSKKASSKREPTKSSTVEKTRLKRSVGTQTDESEELDQTRDVGVQTDQA